MYPSLHYRYQKWRLFFKLKMKFHSSKRNKNKLSPLLFVPKRPGKTKVDINLIIPMSKCFGLGYFYRKRPDENMKFSPNLWCWFPIPGRALKEQPARLDGIVLDHVLLWRPRYKETPWLKRSSTEKKGRSEGHETIASLAIGFTSFVPWDGKGNACRPKGETICLGTY